MTPAARISAAIELLDGVLEGHPAERLLTNWARSNRYAGSGDRAAIRDLVFGALRRMRSCAHVGGAMTGRGLMLGALRQDGIDPASLFTGARFAPAPLDAADAGGDLAQAPRAVQLDCPDWLLEAFDASLGVDADGVLQALRNRAPVYLRVNAAQSTREAAQQALAAEGIETRPSDLAAMALEVTENARRVSGSAAMARGLIELQDAASQAVVEALPLRDGLRVLDYCAGGGGKLLAMGARAALQLTAHDIEARRMTDIPVRAARAGLQDVTIASPGALGGPFDLVLVDAPCSGSGAWRRSPQAKWDLTPERLDDLCAMQADILDSAAALVATGGTLAYVTCSLLTVENETQIEAFLARTSGWTLTDRRRLTPLDGGDGFFLAVLTR